MVCPCVIISLVVSPIAGLLGIETPKTWKGRIVSVLLTSSSTALTVLFLKTVLHIPICGSTGSLAWKILRATIITIPIAVIWSLFYGFVVAKIEKKIIDRQAEKSLILNKEGANSASAHCANCPQPQPQTT